MMKGKYVGWAAMAIALAACSEGNKQGNEQGSNRLDEEALRNLPVVAHSVEVDGHELTVCELALLKDTIDLPLSYWVEDFQPVKLDGRDEALVGQGNVYVSDHYILVGRTTNVPCKLFRRDGTFIGNVGNHGQGPGEYTLVYDAQIDEEAGRIYLFPWNAKAIFVYDLQGKYVGDIPLNKKYDNLVVPKGKFKVDAAKNRVAVMLLPFNYLPLVAWVQDMEGNFLHEVPMNHLKLKPDFSNEVYSAKSSGGLDVNISTFFELRKDTLYRLSMDDGKLLPEFTLDFGLRELMIHDYFEFPRHYMCSVVPPEAIVNNSTVSEAAYMVDKATKQGSFIRIANDYFNEKEAIIWMRFYCNNGYYTLNIEPAVLKERLEKGLQNNPDPDTRKYMEDLLAGLDEEGNNYIFIGKLRTDFGHIDGKQ